MEERLAADICAYLETRLEENVSMDDLCAQFHYGKSRLSAVFHAVTGESVMHWYQARRMEEARRLLLEGNDSIAEIATKLHFDSPQYFSRCFRRVVGVCPRDFRATISR